MLATLFGLKRPQVTLSHLLLFTALWFTLFYNRAFFRNAAAVYASAEGGMWFMASLAVFLFAITLLVLSLLCFRLTLKPVLTIIFCAAAAANMYMNSYNVVIDATMMTNILQTDSREVGDLLSLQLVAQLLLLGVLPAAALALVNVRKERLVSALASKLKLIALSLVLTVLAIAPLTAHYTSFFREHKILRYYANPATPIYSSLSYLGDAGRNTENEARRALGLDAHIPLADHSRELVILVVGEAARADHFSLNGYTRNTNPLLAQEDVVNYPQISSCGTATAYSVPCMFSLSDRPDFDLDEARHQENALDVLAHAGVNVLWRDNNSDSKGVTEAIAFEDFRSPDKNAACDTECRDIGMLGGLPDYIAAHPTGDIVIVLHQMGNHGPAYYKRYPPEFERFSPACHTNQLEACSDEEIGNAYDNAILYTDWFLSEVIHFLQGYDDRFETAMYYMSDHGESLGENGLYLHGLPYILAPDAQTHVASLLWFGASYRVDRERMRERAAMPASHDHYFHTVLGLLEIESAVYNPEQDLIVHSSPASGSARQNLHAMAADL